MKTKTYINILRHASLGKDVRITHQKFRINKLNSYGDILVQKIKVKKLI